MFKRTSTRSVTFTRPFLLSGAERILPPGSYTVETDEELLEELSFPAYRRTRTLIMLPARHAGSGVTQVLDVDPLELEVALERDGAPDLG
jgi:hypothetical protein